jgi:hypothetical protein
MVRSSARRLQVDDELEFGRLLGRQALLALENATDMSAHLSFVHTRGGCGIVLVVTPRRMMEMDNEIAIV